MLMNDKKKIFGIGIVVGIVLHSLITFYVGNPMKKKVMIIGCVLLALILSTAIYRKHVESNIIFHSFNEPVNIKVGTKLEERLIEFYHTENIDDNKVTHEYIYDQDIVNEVQPVTVKVHYQLFTFTNTYKLLIVD